MLKLLKYEFRKTMNTHLILLALTAVAEICFLIGVYGDRTNTTLTSIGVGLLVLIAITAMLMCGIASVASLHRDMNTKQSYMLFMTPHSSPAILGAKVLECVVSLLFFGCMYGVLAVLDLKVLLQENSILKLIKDQILNYAKIYDSSVQLDAQLFRSLAFEGICSWICVILTAFFADTLASSLLNGRKMNGLLTFALFIGLNIAFPYILSMIPISTGLVSLMYIRGAEYVILSVLMYIATAWMMEKYLSV